MHVTLTLAIAQTATSGWLNDNCSSTYLFFLPAAGLILRLQCGPCFVQPFEMIHPLWQMLT